ncbi:hypothetical protein [Streptomyces radicis]|uniref:Uncharacterized protein n=1 Tax=Streptomyces radicis TaxID=1750517 RepID=A0A3A9WC15_9ACTN|nr:hypothetical protein [Streptomyces radicis]RKN10901.1 hypothetical protein D7319_07070 [Streptomyces radicis]RKN25164.1 hypothetical protein D7318_07925 [Streptomyces radicis]
MRSRPEPRHPDPDGPVRISVEFSDGSGPARTVAYPERELPQGGLPAYLAARRDGVRSFVLWADEHRGERVATLVTTSAARGVATFQVLGPQGELIGTFKREKALRGRGLRTRWTVTPVGGPEAVGFKGRIFWWCVWWPFWPVQVPIVLLGMLENGGPEVARAPRRIIWRAGGRARLEFRSRGNRLILHAPETDWRLGAALVALLRAFDGWAGQPWDARKN